MFTSFLFLFERIAVVDPKAVGHGTNEARMVLVEADEKQAIVVRIGFQIHCLIAGARAQKRRKGRLFIFEEDSPISADDIWRFARLVHLAIRSQAQKLA